MVTTPPSKSTSIILSSTIIGALVIFFLIICVLASQIPSDDESENDEPHNNDEKIPMVLWQTGPYDEHDIPDPLKQATQTWTKSGPPHLQTKWFNDKQAEAYVRTHFPQFADDYAVLVPGAFRADVWRLCVLAREGGLYVDSGVHFAPWASTSATEFWNQVQRASLLLVDDDNPMPGSVFQGVIGARANHPVIVKMLHTVIDNIRSRMYGSDSLDITGPRAVARAFATLIPARFHRNIRDPVTRHWVPGLYSAAAIFRNPDSSKKDQSDIHVKTKLFFAKVGKLLDFGGLKKSGSDVSISVGTLLLLKYRYRKIYMQGNPYSHPLLLTKPEKYYDIVYKARNTKHYKELWKDRQVYADGKVNALKSGPMARLLYI